MSSNMPTLSATDWRTIQQGLQVAADSYRETVLIHGGHLSAGATQLLREEADRCQDLAQKLGAIHFATEMVEVAMDEIDTARSCASSAIRSAGNR